MENKRQVLHPFPFFFLSREFNNGPLELLSMDLKSTAGNTHEKQPGTHWSATLRGASHPLHSASLSGWPGRALSCETTRYFIYEYVLSCVLVTALLSCEHSSHTKISDEISFSLWWKNIDNNFGVWTVEVSLRPRGAPNTALCQIDCFSFTLVLYCEWNKGFSKNFNYYFPLTWAQQQNHLTEAISSSHSPVDIRIDEIKEC